MVGVSVDLLRGSVRSLAVRRDIARQRVKAAKRAREQATQVDAAHHLLALVNQF